MHRYAKPRSVEEALSLLGAGEWRVLAGGTDFYPAQGVRPIREAILDIGGLGELRGIAQEGSYWRIGATTSWSDVARAALPPAFSALHEAAREVGSVQIQNTATVAGNLCNASPAADGVPPLLVVDAEVELRSVRGSRQVPLADFILRNRRTVRAPDELVTAVLVPDTSLGGRSAFVKLGSRRYLVISIAMAAARVELDALGRIANAAIAVGACSAVAKRLSGLERALVGLRPCTVRDLVAAAELAELSPIDDVRASASYRRDAAREIVARAIGLACQASGEARAA